MKIYRVKADLEYQGFTPSDESIFRTDMLTFDGHRKSEKWTSPNVFMLYPLKPRGEFLYFTMNTSRIALSLGVPHRLRLLMGTSGELLPLECAGEQFFVFNCTEVINCLNVEKSEFRRRTATGIPIHPTKYEFYPERMTKTLFKIPQTIVTELFTFVRHDDPEFEFKPAVERLGLKGLKFEEVWSDKK